jgi:UDP-N-acetylmuramyl pentapeptide phosphotransferase/UDP-N-acetylglucosamine-1-phosphate transferase
MPFALELLILTLSSSIIGYGVLSLVQKYWKKVGLLDRPHLYRTEAGRPPVPYGIGIAIITTLLLISPLIPYFFEISSTLEHRLHIVLALASIIAIVSFVDDLDTIGKSRWSVPPVVRLLMQIGVGLIIGLTSIKISYISNIF